MNSGAQMVSSKRYRKTIQLAKGLNVMQYKYGRSETHQSQINPSYLHSRIG